MIRLLLVVLFFVSDGINVQGFIQTKGDEVYAQEKEVTSKNEQWINVFVHGTHGFLFGLFSLPNVWHDSLEGSLYRKIAEEWRNYNASYFSQIMSERGLHKVPVHQKELKKIESMTVPIIRAYDQLARLVGRPNVKHDYYTFGWNGVLSQKERRLEAIRFYNELSALVNDFQQQGITPKIRLISHSHGGNLCLNLAAIHELLHKTESADDAHKQESLVRMSIIINELQEIKDDGKKWYKKPTYHTFTIDELIMFATPIQQETEVFCFSPFFKKIVNCYSDNDLAQTADFISTLESKSRSKITCRETSESCRRIKQIRIMTDRCMKNGDVSPLEGFGIEKFINKISFTSLFRGGQLVSDYPNDPTHEDFWHVHWQKHGTFYDPLPLVVLTPLIVHALNDLDASEDLDMNICATSKDGIFDFYKYNTHDYLKQLRYPLERINKIRHELLNTKNLKKVFNFSFIFGSLES